MSLLKRARQLWHACVSDTTKTCRGRCRHLTLVQRCKIEGYLSSGHSQRSIARELGVAPSTISRELRRNHIPEVGYDAQLAHRTAVARRRRATSQPRKVTPRHLDYIHERLIDDWRPDVIAHKTTDPNLKLSTSWSYELIDRDVQVGEDDWKTMLLRKYYKRHGPRKGGGAVHLIPIVSISTNDPSKMSRDTETAGSSNGYLMLFPSGCQLLIHDVAVFFVVFHTRLPTSPARRFVSSR